MPQDAGHAFCRYAMAAPMSLFYIFGRNINDSHYNYMNEVFKNKSEPQCAVYKRPQRFVKRAIVNKKM